jgi:DegV family protein with EDD domain
MTQVRIVADGGCDLPTDEAERLGITVVPVFVTFGDEMVSSDRLTAQDFWARAEQSGVAPHTAAPSPGAFQQAFHSLVSAGHDVVCLTLPAKHSGTFNAAWVAAQEFGERVRVVDSGSISLGMGLQVLHAAQEALAGHSAEAIQRAIEGMRERTSVVFVLDTLEWVRRGGRLERILPLVDRLARSLSVKPIVELTDGDFRLVGVARSSRSALQRLEEEVRERLPVEALGAAYTRNREAAGDIVNRLSAAGDRPIAEIRLIEAGPVFSAHAGPGVVGAAIVRA